MTVATAPRSTAEAILDAARAVFLERGYEAATIAEIRGRSGVSNGSLFHHFPTKGAVADALFQQALADYQAGFLAALLADDARAGVRGAVAFHLSWVQEHADDARLLARLRGAADGQALRSRNRAFFSAVGEWFDRPALRPLTFDVRHALLLGPAETVCRGWLEGLTDIAPAGASEVLAEAAWEALRA